jgi:hypothetical protein
MQHARRGKCFFCGDLFTADARNRGRQKYCSKAACRASSKAARQRRWLAKPENQDYFRGAVHTQRQRAWRAAHPGYWRSDKRLRATTSQDGSGASADNSLSSTAEAPKVTLVGDGKRLEIRHLGFAACESSIRQGVFAGPKSLDAPEPFPASNWPFCGWLAQNRLAHTLSNRLAPAAPDRAPHRVTLRFGDTKRFGMHNPQFAGFRLQRSDQSTGGLRVTSYDGCTHEKA